jgi:Carboxypeptidase regulatory-like domain/TonB dependent receptor
MTKLFDFERNNLREHTSRIKRSVLIAVLCIGVTTNSRAQSMQATIVGNVHDSSGAIIPNALVTVEDTDTDVSSTTTTDGSGNYQMLDLTAGHYSVSVKAPGFQEEVESNLLLAARQQMRANVTLQVGGTSQQVTVNAQSTGAIESESPSISAALTAEDVQSLPTNYRASQSGTSPLPLIQALPGVEVGASGSFSVQGGLPSQSDVTVDGITTQNTLDNYPIANAFPSGESISELRVDGVLNNAEFGQPGEITTISKSGTNKLHGAGFWYFQNTDLNAKPFGAQTRPKIIGNDFGGTAGGPVVIPHLYNGHDKTFFFGTFEAFRLPSQTPYQAVVPTAAMKQGDFSQVAGVQPLTNPYTGGTYPNYTVPINAVSQKFLQFFPNPNFGNTNVYNETTNYVVNQDTSYNSNQFDVRIDQYLGQKALIFGRFTWKNINQNHPEPLAFPSGTSTAQERILVLAGNYNFSPRLLNEFRFGLTLDTEGTTNSFNGPAFAQASGLQGLQDLRFNGVSEFDFRYLTSFAPDRLDPVDKSHTFEYLDSLTWSRDHHNLKFGADVRRLQAEEPLNFFGADQYGTFGFNTGTNFTGQEFADFLIGTPQTTGYDVSKADTDGFSYHYGFYAQDEWKVSSRLNVSYGLRYEYHPAFHDLGGNIGNFDPSVPLSGRVIYPDGFAANLSADFLDSFDACGVGQSTGPAANGAPCTPVLSNSQAGLPASLKTVPKLRFMPRIGLAYRPFNDDKTAIRAGFAMYNITQLGSAFYSVAGTLQSSTIGILRTNASASRP